MTESARVAAADPAASDAEISPPVTPDGVPHGQPVLDRLIALLDLDRIEDAELRAKMGRAARLPRPIDIRYVTQPPWLRDRPREARSQVWMRADGTLPTDSLLHVCVLTYCSDMTLLDAVLARHGVYW